jgi:endonuclease YncB( thermonuclease family)
MPRAAILALVAGLALAVPATAAEITGPARVIDGDTLDMAGTRIRLWGIDALETRQTCEGRDGQTYACGRDSRAVMIELTRDRTVTCAGRDNDRYGRVVAVCRTEASDINAAIGNELAPTAGAQKSDASTACAAGRAEHAAHLQVL